MTTPHKDTFFGYLRAQKKLIFIALAVAVVIYVPFKYAFPLPDLFADSSDYILWAANNFPVAYRPLGYSVFLQFIHSISPSALFLTSIQYALFILSTLFFFFSADYLFGLPAKFKLPALLLVICNPILIFQSNLVSSDSLFCSLTIIWFSACLWIISRPRWWNLLLQFLILYCCLRLRYTAMFFPLIVSIAFVVCRAKIYYKLAGVLATALLIFTAVQLQKSTNEKETGTDVFSGFAGWQLANNALYCYRHIEVSSNDLPTHETQVIDHCVKAYIDSVSISGGVGYSYLWDRNSPLKKYLNICAHRDHSDYLVAWFTASVPLGRYGWYIISHHPASFMQYYLIPNTVNYFYPPTEILANYDYRSITLAPETKRWFGIDTDHLDCEFPLLQGKIIQVYPLLSLLLNLFNIAVLIFCAIRAVNAGRTTPPYLNGLLITWGTFYFGYMVFCILASAINLRFLDYLFVPGFIMPLILIAATRRQRSNE